MGFPGSSAGKEITCNAGDPGSIPGLGSIPGEGTSYPLQYPGFPMAKMVKNLLAMRETWVEFLGWEDTLEEGGHATHSSILAWRIPMDRGAWGSTFQAVAKSQTQLSD